MEKPVVLITGASRGIGKAAALCFAENGFRLAVNALHYSEHLKETEQMLRRQNAGFITVVSDISTEAGAAYLFEKTREAFGSADIVINNAGISYYGLITDMTSAEWHQVINTNLSSVFYCCREALPDMIRKKKGRIINVSSIWGSCGASCEAAYSASKGGIDAFTKALAKELAPSGIQVNAAAFGLIDTDMNNGFTKEELAGVIDKIPSGRMASAGEAGRFLYQLACEAGSYLTGQVICFDGGMI